MPWNTCYSVAVSQAFRFLCLYNTVSITQSCAVQWFKVSYKLIKTNKMKHAAPWSQCPHFQMSPAHMHWIVPKKKHFIREISIGQSCFKAPLFPPIFQLLGPSDSWWFSGFHSKGTPFETLWLSPSKLPLTAFFSHLCCREYQFC